MCIKISCGTREHKRMKHMDVKDCFIREAVSNGKVQVDYLQSSEQLADIMTKGLGKTLFFKHRDNLNLI